MEENLDIVNLIENNPLIRLKDTYNNKLVEKLKAIFSNTEQQLFLGSFYCYLNYDATDDFVIDLDNVWKWLGFGRIDPCKRVLTKHFTMDTDYKVALPQTGKQKAVSPSGEAVETNFAPQVGGAKNDTRGGHNKETIYLNVKTFKKLCLKSNTKKADEIHDYFIKLEEILHEIIKEESSELRFQLEQKQKELEEQNKLIDEMELQPETEGFQSRESGEIYCIRDNSKKGHFKIGIANKSITRVDQLNVGSSTQSLQLYAKFETFDRTLSERLIHQCLHPFRIKNRKEWFYFRTDRELAYAMKTMKSSLEYIEQYNINGYLQFKELTKDLSIEQHLVPEEVLNQLQKKEEQKSKDYKESRIKINQTNSQQSSNRTGTFKGVSWDNEKKQWMSQLQYNYKTHFLGYFGDEIDGAKAYNDYAAFLNESQNTDFALNDIPGYVTVARNVPEINKLQINQKKTSQYNGVSYDSKRKFYVASIRLTGKTYNLGNNTSEIECAKLYNQQALYFNNKYNTNYILNDIPDYKTIAKDVYSNIQSNKSKTSKYYGVSLTRQNKWACNYMMNRKKVHIGTYKTELEACKAYNEVVLELNKNGFNYKINKI